MSVPPGEYQAAHIDGSINLPLDRIEANLPRVADAAGGRRLVMICQSGGRATQAYERLRGAGLSEIAILSGGMNSWVSAGAPVTRSAQERWALERQVRLVAGSLVLLFVVASIWVPGLRYLAGAIGAGLVVAALTNSCMMGMMLAKLPYNSGPRVDVDAALAQISGHGRGR